MQLCDVVLVTRGVRVVRSQLSQEGRFPVYQNSMIPLGYYEHSNREANSTFVIGAGAAGEIGYSYTPFWAADDCYCFEPSPIINSRYLYYILQKEESKISAKVRRSSVPRLSRTVLENLVIPVPSIDIQERIVAILDRFYMLCNDIASGIPAEIEARNKQYAYYRDKILGFKHVA